MFAEEHRFSTASRRVWKWAISGLDIDVGSGLIMPAANDALAIAKEWEAIMIGDALILLNQNDKSVGFFDLLEWKYEVQARLW